MIFVRDIQREVARHFGSPVESMWEPRGQGTAIRERARPRQVAMCLAMRLTNHSYPRVGQFFGRRDHTTVLHAMRVTEQRRRTDPEIGAALREVTLTLLRGAGR